MNQIDVMKQAVMLLRDGPDNNVQEANDDSEGIMSEMDFEFEHEGRVVRPGQVMYVNPEYLSQAGLRAKVERYYGDSVMLRADNGAVPTVPVSALSWEEFPTTRAVGELVLAGFPHPTNREVEIWVAAQKAAKEGKA